MTVVPVRCLTVRSNGVLRAIKTSVEFAPAFVPPAAAPASNQLKRFIAIWDTGATASAISQRVVDACDLKPIGMAEVNTANGVAHANVYLVAMMLPSGVGFPSVKVTLADLGADDCLIGMDIISRGDFAITNRGGRTVFSFRTPSLQHIDFGARPAAPAQGPQANQAGGKPISNAAPLSADAPQLPAEFKKNPFTKAIRFLKGRRAPKGQQK